MTQEALVLQLLREAGDVGVHTFSLRQAFIGNPSERIARLQKMGYGISTSPKERLNGSAWGVRYTLVSEPAIEQASGVDWKTEAAAEPSVISASPDQPSPAPAELLSTLFDSRQFEVAA